MATANILYPHQITSYSAYGPDPSCLKIEQHTNAEI